MNFPPHLVLYAFAYLLIGPLPILTYLLQSGHANFKSYIIPKIGCIDVRSDNLINVFGGAAGFSFGLVEFLLATFVWPHAGFWTTYTYAVALISFAQATLQLFFFTFQVIKQRRVIIIQNDWSWPIKAHLEGCGWVTATSMFWPLFWLQLLAESLRLKPFQLAIRFVRDIETGIKWVASIAALPILGLIFFVFTGKILYPAFEHVNH